MNKPFTNYKVTYLLNFFTWCLQTDVYQYLFIYLDYLVKFSLIHNARYINLQRFIVI